MQQFYWKKLEQTEITNTIWENIEEVKVDTTFMDSIEKYFAEKKKTGGRAGRRKSSKMNSPKQMCH